MDSKSFIERVHKQEDLLKTHREGYYNYNKRYQ